MLVLARKSRETVVVGDADSLHPSVRVTVIEVRNGTVKLGFEANRDVAIYREEVWDRLCAARQIAAPKQDIQTTVYRLPHMIVDPAGATTTGDGLRETARTNENGTIQSE